MLRLAIKNIRSSGFRSLAIFAAVAGVAGFLLAVTLVIAGARYSLDTGLKRLGADLLVVPAGTDTKIETALLMGRPLNTWMPRETLQKVAAVPGVEAVSPQIYMTSLWGAPCCTVPEMYVVVYDPKTDFTIAPWLQKNLGRSPSKGEVIGGTHIFMPQGSKYINLYSNNLTLVGKLEATGTGIDQTLFLTQDTALEISQSPQMKASQPAYAKRGVSLEDNISTIMVRVAPGVDTHRVALQILEGTKGIVPIESPQLFGAYRGQMNGLLWGFSLITLIVWAIAMVLIGMIFSMAANQRRREMAVLRAIGATRGFIFRSVLVEAALLAVSGAVIGIAVAAAGVYFFKDILVGSLKMPFLFPSLPSFIVLFCAGLALAIISVALSALFPALRLSRQELAIAMRE
jgi:putative ABC transport system permease protein